MWQPWADEGKIEHSIRELNMRAKTTFFVLTTILLSTMQAGFADQMDDLERREREFDKKLNELHRKVDDKKKLYFAAGEIVKGKPIQAKQVEARDVYRPTFPADAIPESPVGKTPKFNIHRSSVITIRDFGTPLSPAQLEVLKARNYKGQKGKMQKIVFTRKDFAQGEKFTADQLAEYVMPEDLAPFDAFQSASIVAGRKCKFGKKKFQIVMLHDLDY